jgi:K+-sensing histidine kinase KdpD
MKVGWSRHGQKDVGQRHDPTPVGTGGLDEPRSSRRAGALVAGVLLVSAGHFAVSSVTHPQHVVHVAFRGLVLLLIVTAALWYGRIGAAVGSFAFSAVALANILVTRPRQPMGTLSQLAFIGVYLLVGAVTGALVEREKAERDRRLAGERRAERETVIQALAGESFDALTRVLGRARASNSNVKASL